MNLAYAIETDSLPPYLYDVDDLEPPDTPAVLAPVIPLSPSPGLSVSVARDVSAALERRPH